MEKETEMVRRQDWKDFKKAGMLFFINMILHAFGWAIVYSIDHGKIVEVYPARVRFRGFSEKSQSEGYINLSRYMKENVDNLLEEAEDE